MEVIMRLRKSFLTACAVLSISIIMSGCASKQDSGTIIGAIAGALVASQFGGGDGKLAMVALGTLGGAFLGNEVGKSMDEVDRMKAQSAIKNTAMSGNVSYWSNSNTGNYGTVRALGNYSTSSYGRCREFETNVTIRGKRETLHGKACQQYDGSWRIKS